MVAFCTEYVNDENPNMLTMNGIKLIVIVFSPPILSEIIPKENDKKYKRNYTRYREPYRHQGLIPFILKIKDEVLKFAKAKIEAIFIKNFNLTLINLCH